MLKVMGLALLVAAWIGLGWWYFPIGWLIFEIGAATEKGRKNH
jgi:TM2 domain-containing membrane protein YozV